MGERMAMFIAELEDDERESLLGKLIHVEGDKLIHEELIENMGVLFLAGTDTTSISLAWAFHYLALRPELLQKLANEVRKTAPRGVQAREQLQSMLLLRAVWAEVLRLRGPAPTLELSTTEPTELLGRVLPAGTSVTMATRYMQWHASEMAHIWVAIPSCSGQRGGCGTGSSRRARCWIQSPSV